MNRTSSRIVMLLLLHTGCSAARQSPPIDFTSEEWNYRGTAGSKLTTEHYILYTTCKSKPFVNAMPAFLETCWSAYAELLPSEKNVAGCEAYLFQTRRQWELFTREFTSNRADIYRKIRSGGYTERGKTVSHYDTQRSTLSVMAHEGLHQYLEMTRGRDIPAWLNEGLACYFESFDLTQDNRPIFTPERNSLRSPGLREALSGKSLIPLREILGTHAGIEVQKRSVQVRNYYAQEWGLVLFLMRPEKKNPYYQGFRLLLAEAGTDVIARKASVLMAADTDGNLSLGEAVFRAYITDDFITFQQQFESFLHQLLDLSEG